MTERHPLWDELKIEKALLGEQEKRVFQQYRKLVDAVFAGEITDWSEVEGLLLELIAFGNHYYPAWELYTQLRRYVKEHFSSYVKSGGNLMRILIEDAEQGVETL